MDSITLGPWTIHYDAAATRAVYAVMAASGEVACSCTHCRNFWLAQEQERAYPAGFLALLHRLGMSSRHPAEVYVPGSDDTAGWQYAGWFHFVGTMTISDLDIALSPIAEAPGLRYDGIFLVWPGAGTGCGCWFSPDRSLLPQPFTGLSTVQLEFVVDVPWLLDAPDSPFAEG